MKRIAIVENTKTGEKYEFVKYTTIENKPFVTVKNKSGNYINWDLDFTHIEHVTIPEDVIKLTGVEIKTKYSTRVDYAEALISQLPESHDGRNSWLLNYGKADEAKALREKRGIKFNEEYQAAEISPKEQKIEGDYKNAGYKEKRGNVKLCDFDEIPYGFNSWKEVWKLLKDEKLKAETEVIEFRVAILDRSFFVTKKQIIDYTLQEMEADDTNKNIMKLFGISSKMFKKYLDNEHLIRERCEAPKFPSGGVFSNKTEEQVIKPEASKNTDNKKIKNLNRFEFESLLLSTLEKYFSSKFHK